MKKLLSLLTLLALTSGAFAQTSDPAKLALAREAIAAMQVDRMLDGMTDQIKQMAAQQGQLPATATAEQRKQFETFMGKVTDLAMQEVKAVVAKMDVVYAEVYSEAELKAIVAFFSTPEGKSMLGKQPQVMNRLMPLMQEMQGSLGPKLQALAEEFEKQVKGDAAANP